MYKLKSFGIVAVIVIVGVLFNRSDNKTLLSFEEKLSLRDAVGSAQEAKKLIVVMPFHLDTQILTDYTLIKCDSQSRLLRDAHEKAEASNCVLFDGLDVRIPVNHEDWALLVELNKILNQPKNRHPVDVSKVRGELDQVKSKIRSDAWSVVEISTFPSMNHAGLPDLFGGKTKDQYGQGWTMLGADYVRGDREGYLVEIVSGGKRIVKALAFDEVLERKRAEAERIRVKAVLNRLTELSKEKEPFDK
ncbi:MAG: hypothetical protein AAB322_01625 [Pseudomonadota bacterium]